MQLPVIEFPAVGRMGIIALIGLIHIIFANLAVGGPIVALVSEYLGVKRNDKRFDDLAKNLSVVFIIMMSLGGIFGVGLVALSIGLFPTFFAKTVNVFFWPLFIEVLMFVVEFAFLALYRYRWVDESGSVGAKAPVASAKAKVGSGPVPFGQTGKFSGKRKVHMLFGIIGAIGSAGSMVIINAAASFMMTPGEWVKTGSLLDAILNPTMLPSLFHRTLASLAVAGFFVMLILMRSKDESHRSWGVSYAAKWALIPTVLNIGPGLWYFFSLPEFARTYLSGGAMKLMSIWVLGLAAAAIMVVMLLLISRNAAKQKNGFVIGSFVLVVLTIWAMGFTREGARKPYLVGGAIYSNEISVGDEAKLMKNGSTPAGQKPDGKKLFAQQCSSCHTHTGFVGAVSLSSRFSEMQLKELLKDPAAYGHTYMPPFFGTDKELDALVSYVLQ